MATNYIRDLMHVSLELAEHTKLPFLFMGNPGIAKTTNIRSWANKKGYKVVALIGSQRTAEEILGYQIRTNDPTRKEGSKLVTCPPDWYDEILEYSSEGKRTILFIDEISTAPEMVQGAMLQLIFDRKVGGRNMLPDDTLIVSAANYKGNLPPMNNIMAPTLNRFIIVNVEPESSSEYIKEFLNSESEREENLIDVSPLGLDEKEYKSKIGEMLYTGLLEKLLLSYDASKNPESNVNLLNRNYDDIYEQDGAVYNFISGRSVHYLKELTYGLVNLNLCQKRYKSFIENFLFGLIGNGSNSFDSKESHEKYLKMITVDYQYILKHLREEAENTEEPEGGFVENLDTAIDDWVLKLQGKTASMKDHIPIVNTIKKSFPVTLVGFSRRMRGLEGKPSNAKKLVNEFEKVLIMKKNLDSNSMFKANDKKVINLVVEYYNFYYSSALNAITQSPEKYKD